MIFVKGVGRMQKAIDRIEEVIGFIVRGNRNTVEELVRDLESRKDIKLVYVKRSKTPESFLIIMETRKVGGMMECRP